MRVHNTSHIRGHVMREYLAERTRKSTSKYPWDKSKMGFLATQWGRKKAMKFSKLAAQQHGRNIRKGDASYEAKCPLCNHNDETQAHIMLRCDHPAMKYWRDEYFRKCNTEILGISNKGIKDYLEGLWTWIAQPQEEGEDTSDTMDSRRIALMMGRPIQKAGPSDTQIGRGHDTGTNQNHARN
jgi:hypothetical protein